MAYSHPQHGHPEAAKLRKEAGAYLKQQRERAEITQMELAKKLGFEYYTMVSQVEVGKTRLPPDKMQAWAEAVKADPQEFTRTLLRYYDPFTWQILFGGRAKRK
jgi:transcriptional regulator with XRE-family HTH domain